MLLTEALPYLTSGVFLGAIAGFMPSPLTTFVITETLQHNKRQCAIVAALPIITDVPIILGVLFVLAKISELTTVLGFISLVGALFLVRLACRMFAIRGVELDLQSV
ncbi:MAG TPA: hypothetical protein VLH56_00110 [Dissulfurispiraceae bacterium]|nr:hypothetical protein [Dissulfurispiraceae bacterium]